MFGCVVAMPPRINGWYFRAKAPEQASRREMIVVVAIIIAVASTIIKLSFQVPRSEEAITPGVVVMQHEGDTIRGQSHDAMRRCEICLKFGDTVVRRVDDVFMRVRREIPRRNARDRGEC